MVGRSIRSAAVLACCLALLSCGGDDDSTIKPGEGGGNTEFHNAPPIPGSGGLPGTSGHGSGSGTAGAGGGGPLQNLCPDGQVRTTRATPRVILVLDGSCSMSTPYPANGAMSSTRCENAPNGRWAALRNALMAPGTGVVTRLNSVVEFGLVIFGTEPQCPIPNDPIQPALGNLAQLDAAFPQVQPGMYTPTGLALDWVYENMIEGQAPDGEFQPQIVLLATDGEPNSCDNPDPNYQPSVDAVTKGTGLGVQTYVISLADASGAFHDHLQQLSDLGSGTGAGVLYEPGNPDQLANDLETLVGGAIGCDLTLNGTVVVGAECSGKVTLGPNELRCGVDYDVTDARHISLKGDACNTLKSTPDLLLVADFPCESFQVD